MARSIEIIQSSIIASIKGNTTLYDPSNPDPTKRGLTSPSKVAIWLSWTYVAAVAINIFENILDVYKANLEASIASAAVGTNLWLQAQVLKFQYSATVPQIVQVSSTFSVAYPIVDATLRPITQCAVVNRNTGGYIVKIASNLAPITDMPTKNALISYLSQINFGVKYILVNQDADFLMIGATIYYDGQYSSVIEQSVTDAINAYITDFDNNNFNGDIFLSKIEDAIQAVTGVKDVVLTQIEARAYNILAANATKLVNASTVLSRSYATQAGYIIIDTDAGRTLADTLTFVSQ